MLEMNERTPVTELFTSSGLNGVFHLSFRCFFSEKNWNILGKIYHYEFFAVFLLIWMAIFSGVSSWC